MDYAREELEIEFNSRYDYVSEAYANMNDTPEQLAAEQADCFAEWCVEQQDAMEARGGPQFQVVDHNEIPY